MVLNPNFESAYQDPLRDKRDREHLEKVAEDLRRWLSARNGQREEIALEVQLGTDKPTGKTLSAILKATVRPR